MVGLVVDLSFVEMEARVEDLDFVEKVVVVGMATKVVGFDFEVVDFVDFEKMEDIGSVEKSCFFLLECDYVLFLFYSTSNW